MVLVGLLAAFVPARLAGEMTSIGTLFCLHRFVAVCLWSERQCPMCIAPSRLRWFRSFPDCRDHHLPVHDAFPTGRHLVRLVLWMLIGLDIYACYGIKHSKLEYNQANRHGQLALNMIGIVLAILCVITGLWHQQTVGWEESKVLLIISFVFALRIWAFTWSGYGNKQQRFFNHFLYEPEQTLFV